MTVPWIEQVQALIAQGDSESALRLLASILKSDNKNIDAWLLMGDMMKDPVKKRDCYECVLRLSPGYPAAMKGLERLNEPGTKANPPAPAKVSAQDELFQTLNRKETNELKQIWENNDRSQWPDTAFEIVHDILLARIGTLPPRKQNSLFSDRKTSSRAVRLILFELIFLMFACLGSGAYLFFADNQLFWRDLGRPPEPVSQIVTGDHQEVRVQTLASNIYYCHFASPQECWVKDQPSKTFGGTEPYDQKRVFKVYKQPPALSNVVQMKKYTTQLSEYQTVLTTFAVTADGKVYVWQDGWSTPYDGMIFYMTMPLAVLLAFVFWVLFEAKEFLFANQEKTQEGVRKPAAFSGKVFARWVILNTAGWMVGVFLSYFPFYVYATTGVGWAVYNYSPSLASFIYRLNWLPLGLSIGYMQTNQLKQWGVRSGWWVFVTALGWWIGSTFFLSDVFAFSVFGPIVVTMFSTLFAVSQAYLLKNVLSRSWPWVLATIVGFLALIFLEFHVLFYPPLDIYNRSMAIWAFPFIGLVTMSFPSGYLLATSNRQNTA